MLCMNIYGDDLYGGDLDTKLYPSLATAWTIAHQAPLWYFPGENIGVGCHFLLQGISPTQGLNSSLLHCK